MTDDQPTKKGALQVTRATPAQRDLCLAIRHEVFVEEQQVAPSEDLDGRDDEALHWLAWLDNEPAGTARLRIDNGVARAERVAVRQPGRRHGIGRALMTAVERGATENGCKIIRLHAQDGALDFYRALDYRPEGEFFLEANILHLSMWKRLTPEPTESG